MTIHQGAEPLRAVKFQIVSIDHATLRQHAVELQKALNRLEREREAVQSLLDAYQRLMTGIGGLDKEQDASVSPDPPPLIVPIRRRRKSRTVNKVPITELLLDIYKRANGQPLHAREAWEQVRALGGRSSSHDPLSVVETAVEALRKRGCDLRKVDRRTWYMPVNSSPSV